MSSYKDLFDVQTERPWIVTDKEVKELKKERSINHFPLINFQFHNRHTGFKKGCLHLLIGARGRGKSTFMMSIIHAALSGYKVLLYCTEETKIDVNFKLAKMGDMDRVRDNLHYISERDVIDGDKYDTPVDAIKDLSLGKGIDLIFFDNITTSRFYSSKPFAVQEDLTDQFLKFAENFQKVLFIVAHSNSKTGANDLMDDASCIRGSSHITIVAQYIYMFKLFDVTRKATVNGALEDKEFKLGYVKIDKCRSGEGTGDYFSLVYDKSRDMYYQDSLVKYADYFNAYKDSHKSTRISK
jgi:hypothetical protein